MQEVIGLLHYNEEKESYKKLSILKTRDGGILLSLKEGTKGEDATKVSFSLNLQELSLLKEVCQALINESLKKLTSPSPSPQEEEEEEGIELE